MAAVVCVLVGALVALVAVCAWYGCKPAPQAKPPAAAPQWKW